MRFCSSLSLEQICRPYDQYLYAHWSVSSQKYCLKSKDDLPDLCCDKIWLECLFENIIQCQAPSFCLSLSSPIVCPHQPSWSPNSTDLYFRYLFVDQHRNTNMNDKDHLVGQLPTTNPPYHSLAFPKAFLALQGLLKSSFKNIMECFQKISLECSLENQVLHQKRKVFKNILEFKWNQSMQQNYINLLSLNLALQSSLVIVCSALVGPSRNPLKVCRTSHKSSLCFDAPPLPIHGNRFSFHSAKCHSVTTVINWWKKVSWCHSKDVKVFFAF